MIHEEDFDEEIKRIYNKIVNDDNLHNQLNSLKFFISIEPDFEKDSLKVTIDYCHKYNWPLRLYFNHANKVPYII